MKIAINGFGRIGRTFFRQAFLDSKIEIVAINDLADIDNLAYLLKYDTVYGRYDKEVSFKGANLLVDGKNIPTFREKDPEKLPWGDLGIDVVVEATGAFRRPADATKHLSAGAKRVVISATAKEDSEGEIAHITPGIMEGRFDSIKNSKITSDTSCTTNSVVPLLSILGVNPGIKKGMLTTVHGFTASQNLVDGPKKDKRRGRAATHNIVPTTTSAAVASARVLPGFKNIFDGLAFRVPVITGSISDVTFVSARKTSVEEINNIFTQASQKEQWKGLVKVTREPLVSSDIVGVSASAVIDLSFTKVIGGDLVKVLAWYDNEWGYAYTLLRHVISLKSLL